MDCRTPSNRLSDCQTGGIGWRSSPERRAPSSDHDEPGGLALRMLLLDAAMRRDSGVSGDRVMDASPECRGGQLGGVAVADSGSPPAPSSWRRGMPLSAGSAVWGSGGPRAGLLLAPWYDGLLIAGCPLLALATAAVAGLHPSLLTLFIALDSAALGGPHVVATYTRLGADARRSGVARFLFTGLPLLVLASTATLGYWIGTWGLATVYVYWQALHYTRQSYGIARLYQRKAGAASADDGWTAAAMLHLLPLWGIVYRSYEQPAKLLWFEIRMIPVPYAAVLGTGTVAMGAIAWWLTGVVRDHRRGRLAFLPTVYLLTHAAVFTIGYLLLSDNTQGWLVINVWHNAQYLLVVWLYHHGQSAGRAEASAGLLALLGRNRLLLFFGVCFGASLLMYTGISLAMGAAGPLVAMVIFQAINFHHYIVDAAVWRLRRPALRARLGLAI